MRNPSRKGFTLIELIIIVAIIGVLVGISVPIHKGYTKEARVTEYKNNIKLLENASERYYMDNDTWPKLSDDALTKEQVESYSKKIYDLTGIDANIDEEGKYYEIDYAKLSKYVRNPDNKANYVIQNPVGRVYYLEDLTKLGKQNLRNYTKEDTNGNPENPENPKDEDPIEIPENIIFKGLGPEAYDKNNETYYNTNGDITKTVTWEGNLENKAINILAEYKGNDISYARITFTDSNGNKIKFLDLNKGYDNFSNLSRTKTLHKVVVPEGATKIKFEYSNSSTGVTANIYEICVTENLEKPGEVTNIQYTSTSSSITLNWEKSDENYDKSAVYRNGSFVGYSTGTVFTDTPLSSATEYTYEIQAINSYGNVGNKVEHKASTITPEIKFIGLSPQAFDDSLLTYYDVTDKEEITWEGDLENKYISIGISYGYIVVLDEHGTQLKFKPNTGNETTRLMITSSSRQTVEFIVPPGAHKIQFQEYIRGGYVYDVRVSENLESPGEITNITHTTTTSSITLNWEQSNENYVNAAIYRDGSFVGYSTGKTFMDTPLYSDQEYTYEIQAINSYGNGSKRVSYTAKTITPEIVFRGLTAQVFDGDLNTSHNIPDVQYITWTGDLGNKLISVTAKDMYINFLDELEQPINVKPSTSTETNNFRFNSKSHTVTFVVPENTKKIKINRYASQAYIYEVSIAENLESPNKVTNIKSTSTNSSITLTWDNSDPKYVNSAIYRNGAFAGYSIGKTFTDTPLYSDMMYNYEIQAINTYGNASGRVSYTAKTLTPEIIFRGMTPEAFDNDLNTKSIVESKSYVTWTGDLDNRQIKVSADDIYLKILDASNNPMTFQTIEGTQTNNLRIYLYNGVKTVTILVPEGAVRLEFSGYKDYIHDVSVVN